MKKQIIAIAGGGSTYTPGIIQAVLHGQNRLPVSEIRLFDIDTARNDNMHLIIQYMLEQQGFSDIQVKQTTNPEEAFTNADFIFSQIRVGGLTMREKDEKIPLKYGLVGQETCGLGGFAYGLRSIGPLLELVGFVQKYAPEAWILNYTNPETIISEAVRRQYPGIRMINVCDMTIGIEDTLAKNYGYDRDNWIATYYGLNHFGWYTKIYDKSLKRDIMPELLEKLQTQEIKEEDPSWNRAFNMIRFMVQQFPDNIPNNYLEYYFYPDMYVNYADSNYTRANTIMDGRERKTHEMAEKIRNKVEGDILDFYFGVHGVYIVDIAAALLNDEKKRFMLIVENKGAIPNLRDDAVIEVPAYVGETGVEAIRLSAIGDFHKGLMEAQVAAEKLLVDAYFENSYQKALQAFTLNQTVPNATVAKKVLDEMMKANKAYWPELK
ncbi:6-phospho-alpha-glucosidase [Listeria booriae]|uniref:6-phospho-alpha-glucosidase n=1 Tax=Listeria booriae TaxID=1552123 RepID=A0A842FLQ2_9LIST|nr:6-phospho-alpha-glucosidase [Listeria booriae]MBC2283919.1 6-phospho-alpha-glucosidase [Listeria booriae]MBC2293345.1 6-phospho-alpha-glucosidase [Listeria booriae]